MQNKWNIIGTNALLLLLFLPVKPAKMQNTHTHAAKLRLLLPFPLCNPAWEHAVRSTTVPARRGRDVVVRHESNVVLEFLA